MFLATTSVRTLMILKKKKDVGINAKVLKSKDEFTIIGSDCCDVVIKHFDKRYCDYFTNIKKCFTTFYSRDEERRLKIQNNR